MQPVRLLVLASALVLAASGCHAVGKYDEVLDAPHSAAAEVPRELSKITLPTYVIEPPDILLIDAVKIVPKSPYRVESFDVLQIQSTGTLPDAPIAGTYTVSPGGTVDLGPIYGPVAIAGLTIEEARDRVQEHLQNILREPVVSVQLVQSGGEQSIVGEHLVGPDGTVHLGVYGDVYVAGMCLEEAKAAIEAKLGEYLEDPEVSVDIFSYNSKVYYIITQGAGLGEQVIRLPITGNETVLDGIALLGGLGQFSSTRLWIARPTPHGTGYDQILPVNWNDITQGASTTTNYQLLPGDRLYVAEDKVQLLNSFVVKVVSPFERVFGYTLLGIQTVQAANRLPNGQNQGGGFF